MGNRRSGSAGCVYAPYATYQVARNLYKEERAARFAAPTCILLSF